MFKADLGRTGYAAEALGPPVSLAWKMKTEGEFYSSPALVGGSVFLGNSDGHVYAYALQDGTLKWKAELGGKIYGSSPSVVSGVAYVNAVDGCAYGLREADGGITLKHCLKRSGYFGLATDILGSPLAEGDRLYFGSDNHEVHALKLPGGEKLWSFHAGGKIHDAAPAATATTLYITCSDGRVYALDKASGALRWKSSSYDLLNTTVAVLGGRLYFGAKDGKFRCLDADSGKLLWAYRCGSSIMSSPAVDATTGSVVFGSLDHYVYCLNLGDGKRKWRFETGGMVLASPLITGTTAWIGSFDGKFYAFDLRDGKELWSMDLGKKIFSSAAVFGDRIAVGCLNGAVYCFQAHPLGH
jgi:outer membrane protein assembly factor BamB